MSQTRQRRADPAGYLLRLAELELIDREGRMVERRIKAARFWLTQRRVRAGPLATPPGRSAFGGKAEVDFGRLNVCS